MTSTYPVDYTIPFHLERTRLQLAIRVVAFLVLGAVGITFGTVFGLSYLGLPILGPSD